MLFKVKGTTVMVAGAEVRLTDRAAHDLSNYNHPVVNVMLQYEDQFGPREVCASFRFQRHLIGSEADDCGESMSQPARYWTDTAKRWTISYAGKLELYDANWAEVFSGGGFALSFENQLRLAFRNKVAAMHTKMTRVATKLGASPSRCELMVLVGVLEEMGLPVEKTYIDQHGNEKLLYQADGMSANASWKRDNVGAAADG
jgi:hypothetical protein